MKRSAGSGNQVESVTCFPGEGEKAMLRRQMLYPPELRDPAQHQQVSTLRGSAGTIPEGVLHGNDPVKADAYIVLLSNGGHALVSAEDYERVRSIRWRSVSGGCWKYAVAHEPGSGKRGKTLLMHRFIVDAQPGQVVDHKDGNTLNNTRDNLRVCTTAENIRNQRAHQTRKSHSKLKGVYRSRMAAGERRSWFSTRSKTLGCSMMKLKLLGLTMPQLRNCMASLRGSISNLLVRSQRVDWESAAYRRVAAHSAHGVRLFRSVLRSISRGGGK